MKRVLTFLVLMYSIAIGRAQQVNYVLYVSSSNTYAYYNHLKVGCSATTIFSPIAIDWSIANATNLETKVGTLVGTYSTTDYCTSRTMVNATCNLSQFIPGVRYTVSFDNDAPDIVSYPFDGATLTRSYAKGIIGVGITPKRPESIFKCNRSGVGLINFILTQGDSVYLNTVSSEPFVLANPNLYTYQIDWRANTSDTWKTIDFYPFTVPYAILTDSSAKGKRIYLRSRIIRSAGGGLSAAIANPLGAKANGQQEIFAAFTPPPAEDDPVKYSPYYYFDAEVRPKVDVKLKSFDTFYCVEDSTIATFKVGKIYAGDEVTVERIYEKYSGNSDEPICRFSSQQSGREVRVKLSKKDNAKIRFAYNSKVGSEFLPISTKDTMVTILPANPAVTIDSLRLKDVQCHGGNTGEVKVLATGGWPNSQNTFTYSLGSLTKTSTTSSVKFSGLSAKKYVLKVEDSKGCTSLPDTITISQPKRLAFSDTIIHNVNCNGGADGSIKVSVKGGVKPYSLWCSPDIIAVDSVFANLFSGNYTIQVTDSNRCVAKVENIQINQPTKVNVVYKSSLDISCPGGSDGYIELSASGGTPGYEYSRDRVCWQKGIGFSNLSHADSTFFARDTLGCLDTLYHPIAQPKPIRANPQITNVTCFGDNNGSVDINLSGGTPIYSIVFKDSEDNPSVIYDFSGTTKFSDLKAGEYSLNIIDSNSCSDSATFRVEQPLLPLSLAVDSVVNPTCFGYANGVVRLKPVGGWGGYTYSHFGTAESNPTGLFNTLTDSTHQFIVTDAMGCAHTIDATLTQPSKLEVKSVSVSPLLCNGDGSGAVEVTAKGGTPSYRYNFGLGFTTQGSRFGLMGGKLPFIIRDSLGCELNDTAIITQPEVLKALISSRNSGLGTPSCSDSVRINATGGVGAYMLSILGNSITLSGKGYLFYDQPNGRYPLVITDGNGCSVNDTANISNLPKPEFRLVDITSPSCANSTDGRIAIDAWSSTGNETFNWYFVTPTENKLVATTASGEFNAARKGRYIARIVDQYLCSTDSVVDVSGPSNITIDLRGRNPKCNGYPDGNIRVVASGGVGAPYSYEWYDANRDLKSTVDSTGAVPAGSYYVVVKDLNGCKDSTTFTLTDPPSLNPVLPSTVTICKNQPVYLADAGVEANSYIWTSPAGFNVTTRVASLSEPGTYSLIISDIKGCQGSGNLTLLRSDREISANFIVADKAYVGDTLVLIEMSWPIPELIEWEYPSSFKRIDGNDYSVYLEATEEGNFNLKLTSHVGECWADITKTITIGPARNKRENSIQQRLIESVVAYPNPNSGNFSVEVKLTQSHDAVLEIYSLYGQRLQAQYGNGLVDYKFVVNQFRTPGIYLVRVTVGSEQRKLRVVVE